MSRFFIERPIFANVIAIVTVILGVVCLATLPIAQYPKHRTADDSGQHGLSRRQCRDRCDHCRHPIERAVNGVENSLYMQSTSGSDGSYTLTVTFAVWNRSQHIDCPVQNAVSGALSQLPQDVQTQGVTVQKVSTSVLLIGSLYAEDDRFDEIFLSNYATINLRDPIARLPGWARYRSSARSLQHADLARPQQAEGLCLTVLDVQNAIQSQNAQVAAGQLGGPPVSANQVFQFTVNTLGRLSEVTQFENIIVKIQPPTGTRRRNGPRRQAFRRRPSFASRMLRASS